MNAEELSKEAMKHFKEQFLYQAAHTLIPKQTLSAEDTRYFLKSFLGSRILGFLNDDLISNRDWGDPTLTEDENDFACENYYKGFERGFLLGINVFQDLVLLMQEKEKPADGPGTANLQAGEK